MTDAELVERARAGDVAAFGALVERYQHLVVRAAAAVLGRRDQAEDVAQDVFLKAYGAIGAFRGEASVKTWLLAITWREALSHRRSLALRLRRLVTDDVETMDPPSHECGPDVLVEHRQLHDQVARMVRTLPAKYRTALMLAATGDFTFEEMSQALGVAAGTLKWRVSEARRRLRAKLAQAGVVVGR